MLQTQGKSQSGPSPYSPSMSHVPLGDGYFTGFRLPMLLQGVSLPYQNMQCGLPGCLPQLSLSLRSFYLLGLGVLIADCWVNMAGFQSAETASPPVGFCHCSVVSENWGSLPHPHSLVNRVQQGMDDLCSTIGNSVSQVGTGHSSVPSSPQHCQDLQACDSI